MSTPSSLSNEVRALVSEGLSEERRLLSLSSSPSALPEYPFIVCNMDQSTLGTERLQVMADHFGGSLEAEGHAGLHTLHNSDGMTCAITASTVSSAEAAPSHLAIHPITPNMKFPANFLADLDNGDLDDIQGIRLVLCPKSSPPPTLITSLTTLLTSPPTSITESCKESIASLDLIPSTKSKPYIFIDNVGPILDQGCLHDALNILAPNPAICSIGERERGGEGRGRCGRFTKGRFAL
jgi:hypothetical protein